MKESHVLRKENKNKPELLLFFILAQIHAAIRKTLCLPRCLKGAIIVVKHM